MHHHLLAPGLLPEESEVALYDNALQFLTDEG